jgi:hypothetical protein
MRRLSDSTRCHTGTAADADNVTFGVVFDGERAVRATQRQLVADLELRLQQPGEMPARVAFDDELELAGGARGGRHRETAVFLGARDHQIGVLTGLELVALGFDQFQFERHDVRGEVGEFDDAGPDMLQRNGVAQLVLVEVDELDLAVAVGVGLAQQYVPFLAFVVGQREGGVAVHLDVTVEQKRLARRALALPAAVHQRNTLTERRIENGLALVDLDLEVNRLEPDLVGITHRTVS